MHIVHINTFDVTGGAGRAAYRLHTGLIRAGHSSRILARTTHSPGSTITGLTPSNGFSRFWELSWRKFASFSSLPDLFYPVSTNLPKHPWIRETDIIHLHNIHGYYFSFSTLIALSRLRPIVWTLHDQWAFTGHCSYSNDCQRWQIGCGRCPDLSIYPSLHWDTTHFLWTLRQRAYKHSQIAIVSPSHWLSKLAKTSPLLKSFTHYTIPNSIDTEIFKPYPVNATRAKHNLPGNVPLVLFTAFDLEDRRKGGDLLLSALHQLAPLISNHAWANQLHLVMAGSGKPEWISDSPFPVIQLGSITDETRIAEIYAACDAFVLPSRADNLPNGLLESLACGTPCFSFRVGGIPEVISNGENGYLAEPEAPADLAAGLATYLMHPESQPATRQLCRTDAVNRFSLSIQAGRMLDIYQETIAAFQTRAQAEIDL